MAKLSTASITYRIFPVQPSAHRYQVRLTIAVPSAEGQIVGLPAWIPGSYMVRNFARHIDRIHASSLGRSIVLTKLDKDRWRAAACLGALQLDYEVYACDLSVRGAHLDEQHGFFNGCTVFLYVEGQENQPCAVEICRPEGLGYQYWRVMTSLREKSAKRYGFGWYEAENYDELIDHPVEMGNFICEKFVVCHVTHEIAITGSVPKLDMLRLTRDLAKICATHIQLFEPKNRKAPVDRYVFLVTAVGEGYGGLEHRASTALLCARADLPVQGQIDACAGYRRFLGLCSHEYFHTWHVKRIKPAVFAPYDLHRENYTHLLWLFEGFTSYYDDLALLRSGVMTLTDYLDVLGKNITQVMRAPGRFKQTLAESSFDAWIKYYSPNENTPNATVSYYSKGALLALALDLSIRQASQGRKSLDDVMRLLWQEYGRTFYQGDAQGLEEEHVIALFNRATKLDLAPWLARAVHSTQDLPLTELLQHAGFSVRADYASTMPSLGAQWHEGTLSLTYVYDGESAQQAGLSAGDTLVAIDGLRVQPRQVDILLGRYRAGDMIDVHVFRRDELRLFRVKLASAPASRYTITPASGKHQSIGAWPAAISA
ncbi:MAG: M61 family metallopeptidase [Ottowia sp.]|nr:M61 family metallopeptidase [Ottowia sp.]